VRAALGIAVAVALGCASAPAQPKVPRLSEFRAPAQTSIDVLLGSTVDLGLSTGQVAQLVKLQAELNEKVKPLKEEMAAVRERRPPPPPGAPQPAAAPPPPAPPPPPSAPMNPYPPPVGPGRWVGAVRNSGDIGVPREHRSERPEPLPPDYAERRARLEDLVKKYDAEDQAAYAQAEALLDDAQKATARKMMAARAAERAKPAER